VPSSLLHQATAEPGPLPSDPQGDASRGTMSAEGCPVCMVLSRSLLLHDFRYALPRQPGLDARGSARMISFKGAHFPQEIMLMGVRWYLASPLS
jgi:hypothetical protein